MVAYTLYRFYDGYGFWPDRNFCSDIEFAMWFRKNVGLDNVDHFAVTQTDTIVFYEWRGENDTWRYEFRRPYLLKDSCGRTVDIRRELLDVIINCRVIYSYWYKVLAKGCVFRRDPVRYAGALMRLRTNHKKCYGNWRRYRNYAQIERQYRNPEFAPYMRKKARVPDYWAVEPYYESNKSWKDQSKCRKQWQYNFYKKRGKKRGCNKKYG